MLTDELLAKLEMMERDHNRLKAEVYELRRRVRQAEIAGDDRDICAARIDGDYVGNYTRFQGDTLEAIGTGKTGVGHARPMARNAPAGAFVPGDLKDQDGAEDAEAFTRDALVVYNLGWPVGYDQRCLLVQDGYGDYYVVNPVPYMGWAYIEGPPISVGGTGMVGLVESAALNGRSDTTWWDKPTVEAYNICGTEVSAPDIVFVVEDNFQRGFNIVGVNKEINP